MSSLVKRWIPTLLFATIPGLVVLAGYLTQHPTLVYYRDRLIEGAVIVAAFAFILGMFNILRVHGGRIGRRQPGWLYSLVLLLAVALAAIPPLLPRGNATANPIDRALFDYVISPLGASLAALVAFALALAAFRLPRMQPVSGERRHALTEIRDGMAEVLRIDAIRPIVILMFFTGILYIGVFMVQLPIIVRDVYRGDSAALAILNTCFMLGTSLSAIVMTRYGHIRQQGRALILSTTASGLIMALILLEPPLYGLYAIAGLWGISGGISMVMGRTLVQAAAPADHRGRVLSIFQLGYMGGAPIGALLIGFAIDRIGPINAIFIPTIGMIFLMLIARYGSGVWYLRYEEEG